MNIVVSAPGKLHLLGEHVVVYGKPALLTAVDKRCHVRVTDNSSDVITIDSTSIHHQVSVRQDEIISKTKSAQRAWEEYTKTNKRVTLTDITKQPLDYAVICIGESLRYFQKELQAGFTFAISSDTPVGAGMGSSAGVAVAIAATLSLLFTRGIDQKAVLEIAYRSEQKKHGRSAADTIACCYGGWLWYQKQSETKKTVTPIQVSLPKNFAKRFFIIDTGTPKESTGEMVGLVRKIYTDDPEKIEKAFSSQEKLTKQIISALQNQDEKGIQFCIRQGQRNLERLGVVSPFVRKLIRALEKSDASVKICGAGGKSRATGILLGFANDLSLVSKVTGIYNLEVKPIILGCEGVRQESL